MMCRRNALSCCEHANVIIQLLSIETIVRVYTRESTKMGFPSLCSKPATRHVHKECIPPAQSHTDDEFSYNAKLH